MHELSDAQLVARCRHDDAEAWNQLVERFSRYVYAITLQGFRLSQADAEDVFQDVFAKVYENLGRLRDDEAVRGWIAQLTRRTCIDRLRLQARVGTDDGRGPVAPDDTMTNLEDALTVRDALAGLSGPCQEILDRFFARDESYRVIAEALDLPAGTIASRISRCLERLKAAMEESNAPARPVDG